MSDEQQSPNEPVDDVSELLDVLKKSKIRVTNFKKWREKMAVPETEYYKEKISTHVEVLRRYLELVFTKDAGKFPPEQKAKFADLYAEVLKQ
jgi:hypothetical protein